MWMLIVSISRMYFKKSLEVFILFVSTVTCNSVEKHEMDSGFIPKLGAAWDQIATESRSLNITEKNMDNKEGRFGFLTYGVPSSSSTGVTGLNGQLKLDLGGVVLGALIGFGAVIILPKIVHLLSTQHSQHHGYSGYGYRKVVSSIFNWTSTVTMGETTSETCNGEDVPNFNSSSLIDILSRVDETLAQHNIDSSSCMQHVLCSYVRLAREKVLHGDASSLDIIMDSASNNSIVDFMLDGTSLQQAMNFGRSGGNCATEYARCLISKDTLAEAVKSLISN